MPLGAACSDLLRFHCRRAAFPSHRILLRWPLTCVTLDGRHYAPPTAPARWSYRRGAHDVVAGAGLCRRRANAAYATHSARRRRLSYSIFRAPTITTPQRMRQREIMLIDHTFQRWSRLINDKRSGCMPQYLDHSTSLAFDCLRDICIIQAYIADFAVVLYFDRCTAQGLM